MRHARVESRAHAHAQHHHTTLLQHGVTGVALTRVSGVGVVSLRSVTESLMHWLFTVLLRVAESVASELKNVSEREATKTGLDYAQRKASQHTVITGARQGSERC
jgi:hypothetical protein